ncbi:SLC13 family permease [Rubrivivax albus]|uniref:SLC13 family permease n=1 Tax=Rubrivivax albus TaxID=2499835 RepID=A0A437JVR1_9BURK|nr:SLC13 family permease [Rubrivivax albus]RVT51482.1 SLC13 family permease [Rubrivivax albus]
MSLELLAIGPLSGHAVLMLVFALGVFATFALDRFQIGSVCLAVLILLPTLFFVFPHPDVEPYRFFGGFGHPALVAICALMVLGHALVLTGALEPAARRLAVLVEKSPRLALLAVLLLAAAASGVMNDTPVVVLLMPLLIAALKRAGQGPGFMLMPMNFAVLIGGMATTIGTSTNLIVVSLAASLGAQAFGIFEFFPLVALAAAPALVYLWLVAPWLLRHVSPAPTAEAQPVFEAELRVAAGSWLDGAQVREVLKRSRGRLPLRRIRRAGGSLLAPLPTATLRAGDSLVVQDTAERLKEHEQRLEAKLHAIDEERAPDAEHAVVAAQLVVTPESPLVGRTARGARFADTYGLILIGLRKASGATSTREQLPDQRLAPGDVLLLQGPTEALQALQRDALGLLLDERLALPRQRKSLLALGTLAGVVGSASLGGVPIALAALVGVLVLLGTRTVAWKEVGSALSVNVVLIVAASLALGDALTVTGATGFLAGGFVQLTQGWPAMAVLAALMGLVGVLTNFVSNNAAAAIGTPLAVEVARLLGLPPEPYVLAVLFGCNLCYVTPMAYQTNLLVMNAAGYAFRDFVRVGGPLFLLMWASLSWVLARHYGLV